MDTSTIPNTPVSRSLLADQVYEHLLEAILGRKLTGGTVLSEVELAKQFHVSRTPVREALRRLNADELVHRIANHSARVVRFTQRDVTEIFQMREVLETGVVRLGTGRLTADQLQQLRQLAEQAREGTIEFDHRFHKTLAAFCGNKRLWQQTVRNDRLMWILRGMAEFSRALRDEAYRAHLELLEVMEAGDADAAQRVMSAHIRRGLDDTLKALY